MIIFPFLALLLDISQAQIISSTPGPDSKLYTATTNVTEECVVKRTPTSKKYPEIPYSSSNPMGPVVECSFLPDAFIDCEDPVPVPNYGTQLAPNSPNTTYTDEGKCTKMGGNRAEDIEHTNVMCRVLPCIECRGSRTFQKLVPCIKYTGHYFLSTLLYSIFLGVVAVDRFCLGYSAMAVGKLMTLGGFGIWWIVDIFLLVFGILTPADDSNWEPYY